MSQRFNVDIILYLSWFVVGYDFIQQVKCWRDREREKQRTRQRDNERKRERKRESAFCMKQTFT